MLVTRKARERRSVNGVVTKVKWCSVMQRSAELPRCNVVGRSHKATVV